MALLLSDIPDCAFRVHVLSCLSLGDLVSLLLTERRFAGPVRAAPQWDAATAQLSRSNTFDVHVRERLEGDGDAGVSEHLLSDPRLDAAAYAALPAIARFQALAGFCRATVGHLRALHNVWGEADWSFEDDYEEHAATPRSLHINKLVALERRGKPHAFSRYNVMANLIKLTLAQNELCSSYGPSYWYDRLGEPDCSPFEGSSYRDSLTTFFVDVFVGDGDWMSADPALAGVEPGSNAHLKRLTARTNSVPLTAALFGPKLLRNFLVLKKARLELPSILQRLKEAEEAPAAAE